MQSYRSCFQSTEVRNWVALNQFWMRDRIRATQKANIPMWEDGSCEFKFEAIYYALPVYEFSLRTDPKFWMGVSFEGYCLLLDSRYTATSLFLNFMTYGINHPEVRQFMKKYGPKITPAGEFTVSYSPVSFLLSITPSPIVNVCTNIVHSVVPTICPMERCEKDSVDAQDTIYDDSHEVALSSQELVLERFMVPCEYSCTFCKQRSHECYYTREECARDYLRRYQFSALESRSCVFRRLFLNRTEWHSVPSQLCHVHGSFVSWDYASSLRGDPCFLYKYQGPRYEVRKFCRDPCLMYSNMSKRVNIPGQGVLSLTLRGELDQKLFILLLTYTCNCAVCSNVPRFKMRLTNIGGKYSDNCLVFGDQIKHEYVTRCADLNMDTLPIKIRVLESILDPMIPQKCVGPGT